MFEEIKTAILKGNTFAILPHINGDGDCLGSAYALKMMLEGLGKKSDVITEEGEDNSRVCRVLKGVVEPLGLDYDTVIAIDCGDKKLLGNRISIFESCQNTINIDHHPSNDYYAKYNYIDSTVGAAGIIVYKLAKFMKLNFTSDIAANLYVSIISDTGGFAFSNTNSETHLIVAELLKFDINHAKIYAQLFNKNSKEVLEVQRDAFNSLEIHNNGTIAVVSLTKEQIEHAGATSADTGSIIDIPRKLDTAVVAMSFKENGEGIKVSLRSEGVDVSSIARKFGGGGHVKASACTVEGDLETVKKMLIEEAAKLIEVQP